MASKLGNTLKNRREELGLRRSDLARRLGYRNLTKGSRRIHHLEQDGWDGSDLLKRIVDVLGLDPLVALDLIQRDRDDYVAEWNRWADEPVRLSAAVRLIPAVFGTLKIPESVKTSEEAVAWGVETAKRLRKKVFIMPSRRLTYTIHEDGRVDEIVATPDRGGRPYMAVGRAKFLLEIGDFGPPKPSSDALQKE